MTSTSQVALAGSNCAQFRYSLEDFAQKSYGTVLFRQHVRQRQYLRSVEANSTVGINLHKPLLAEQLVPLLPASSGRNLFQGPK